MGWAECVWGLGDVVLGRSQGGVGTGVNESGRGQRGGSVAGLLRRRGQGAPALGRRTVIGGGRRGRTRAEPGATPDVTQVHVTAYNVRLTHWRVSANSPQP